MPGKLSGALPSRRSYRKTELVVGYGAHRGYFVGLGDRVEEETQDRCRACKGQATIDGQECRTCAGTGRRRVTKVAILYQLGRDLVQEEWVTYVISQPGKLKDGTVKSASTLWGRMRAFSGGITDPDAIDDWYSALPEPIRIPIEMIVADNQRGDGVVIASVRRLNPKPAASASQNPPQYKVELPPEPPTLAGSNDDAGDDIIFTGFEDDDE